MTPQGDEPDQPERPVEGSSYPEHEPAAQVDPDEPLPGLDLDNVVDAPVDAGDPSGLRSVTEIKKPSTLGGVVYLAVLAATLVGVVVAATGAWRSGVSWIALSLLVAAGTRLALADDDAGMLQVRRKFFDATLLIGMGVVLLVLVASIPDQPT